MDMNKAFFLRKEDEKQEWTVIDAEGEVLGRLATRIADVLRGKDTPQFTPHANAGKHVIVINAGKVHLTGDKLNDKEYVHYTGYMGGQRFRKAKDIMAKNPGELIELAVKRMLPKSRLGSQWLRNLRVYAGNTHPHVAQIKTKTA